MVSTRREQGIEPVGLMFKEGKSTARSTDRHKVKICVIGGVNLDVTFLVDEILGSTETMTIHERSILPGGKAEIRPSAWPASMARQASSAF